MGKDIKFEFMEHSRRRYGKYYLVSRVVNCNIQVSHKHELCNQFCRPIYIVN